MARLEERGLGQVTDKRVVWLIQIDNETGNQYFSSFAQSRVAGKRTQHLSLLRLENKYTSVQRSCLGLFHGSLEVVVRTLEFRSPGRDSTRNIGSPGRRSRGPGRDSASTVPDLQSGQFEAGVIVFSEAVQQKYNTS